MQDCYCPFQRIFSGVLFALSTLFGILEEFFYESSLAVDYLQLSVVASIKLAVFCHVFYVCSQLFVKNLELPALSVQFLDFILQLINRLLRPDFSILLVLHLLS